MSQLQLWGKRARAVIAYREVSVLLILMLEILVFYLIIDVYIKHDYFVFFKAACECAF